MVAKVRRREAPGREVEASVRHRRPSRRERRPSWTPTEAVLYPAPRPPVPRRWPPCTRPVAVRSPIGRAPEGYRAATQGSRAAFVGARQAGSVVPTPVLLRGGAPRRAARVAPGAVASLNRPAYPGGMTGRLARITADPHTCQGLPCVRGLRIPVSVVLRHLAAGKSSAEIIEELPELEPEDIADCLRYAAWLASGRAVELTSAA